MNLMLMELRRLFKNRGFVLMYLLFLGACLYFSLHLDLAEDIDYRSLIAVIDEDDSLKSRALVAKINAGTALKADVVDKAFFADAGGSGAGASVDEASEAEGSRAQGSRVEGSELIEQLILDRGYAAVLRIPRGFFDGLPRTKLEYSYAENDQISPALIDLITQGFIEHAVERVLEERLIKEFGSEVVSRSLEEYEGLKGETMFDLEVIESVEEGAGGLVRKLDKAEIANSSSLLLYIAGLGLLFAIISLNVSKLNDRAILGALLVRNNSLIKYFWLKKLLDYVLISLPLLSSTLIVLSRLGFRAPALIYFIAAGLVVNILVYELCEFIVYSLEADYALYLMVFVGIGLALVGGAFFSLDLLPKAMIDLSQKTPLGYLKSAFFGSYELNFNYSTPAAFILLSLGLMLINYRLLRRKAVYSE